MKMNAFIYSLCVFSCFYGAGLTVMIHTEKTVMTRLGEEAQFRCQLLTPTDVLEVHWRKILPDGEKRFIASHDKYFGQRVEPDFSSRVEVQDTGLQSSSLVIKQVGQEDVGCYSCLFITYPEGAFTETTCLELYELHGPFLSVEESNSPDEAVVSCSATGRPTPTVTITIPQLDLHVLNKSSVSIPNNDSTVTVTETAVLSRLHANTTEVECTVGVHSGPQRTESIMLPGIKQSSDGEGFDEDLGPSVNERSWTVLFVLPVFIMTCCVLGVFLLFKQKTSHQGQVPQRESLSFSNLSQTGHVRVEFGE